MSTQFTQCGSTLIKSSIFLDIQLNSLIISFLLKTRNKKKYNGFFINLVLYLIDPLVQISIRKTEWFCNREHLLLQACLMSHYQRRVYEMCDCYDNAYPIPKDATGEVDPKCYIILNGNYHRIDTELQFFDLNGALCNRKLYSFHTFRYFYMHGQRLGKIL